ncbi:SOS response-associated peptidase [Paenibacillus marinisediminis]
MCGRYTLTVTWEELLIYLELEEAGIPFHQPRYNVAPGQMVPAMIHDGDKRRLGPLKWGLIPSWAEDEKIGWRTINARAETLADKPAFKRSFARKRCLIPADSFYEWKKLPDGGKQPMRIIPAQAKLFTFAGLYDTWTSPDGERVSTCTIVTTTPNRVMEPIHDRMPVILGEAEAALWLDRSVTDTSRLQPLLQPCPADWLDLYPVGAQVGNVKNDSPACIEAIAAPPTLF